MLVTDPKSTDEFAPVNYLQAKAGNRHRNSAATDSDRRSAGGARRAALGARCDDADLHFERIAVTRQPPLFERRPSRAARRRPGIALQGSARSDPLHIRPTLRM